MVALVKDDAFQLGGLAVSLGAPRGASPVEGRLGQDQGMIGDDDVGAAGTTDRLLHEAGSVMRTAGMDALPAPIHQIGRAGLGDRWHGEQGGQPSGEVAAGHVAVAGGAHPPRGQAHADQVGAPQLGGVGLILKVEQAEIILAPLADHGLFGADLGVGVEGVALALDLALEGAGIGGDPDGRTVGLGPERGRGEVAQGLTDAGASLSQHHARLAFPFAGLEGESGFGGEFCLGRAGFVQSGGGQELRQARGGLLRLERFGARLAGRRLVLPLGDPRPGIKA